MLQELTLQGALGHGIEEPQPPVDLPHLLRLHVEISRSAFDRDGTSRVIRLFFSLICPGPHCKLYIETDDLGALPPPTTEGSFSSILQYTDTIRLAATRNRLELHGCRNVDVFWSYITTHEWDTHPLGAADFRSSAMLAGLLHIADVARVSWDKIVTLSITISDLAMEGLSARPLALSGSRPPYHTFFTKLFGKCANIRSLSLSTIDPTAILVNALSMGCRSLTDISIDGRIKDPTLLSLWVQERCFSPQQCDRITKLLVKHRDDLGGYGMSLHEYEEMRGDAIICFTSLVPEFEWKSVQHELPADPVWQSPWDDFEFIL
jgi:hypothetical protein